MALSFTLSDRLTKLPPYLFAEVDAMKRKKIKEGVNVIDFGVGDPDLPTPQNIVNSMKKAVENVENQKYPSYEGKLRFRESVSRFYKRRKGVEVDPEKEVVSLIGSKEGIAHLPLAFVNPNDYVLIPDPGYPVYFGSTIFAGGKPYVMPLIKENGFIPDLQSIPTDVAKKTKIMYLNYPNNPTAGIAEAEFIKEVIDFCVDNGIILAQDAAYSEVSFDYRVLSFLEYDKSFEVVVEFNSLSKTYNMTGWRIGYAVGNSEVLSGLVKVKTNVDSGVFEAIQEASITALDESDNAIERNNTEYVVRRDLLVHGLKEAGLDVSAPKATFYVWCETPEGYDSMSFTKKLLDEAGVLVTPGVGFGEHGEGFVRFALTRKPEIVEEAVKRINSIEI